MQKNKMSHLSAILQALLVTFLWSSSFVIIKIGLAEIPPLIFAGMRYMLAFLILLPFILTSSYRQEIKKIRKSDWKKLFALGLIFYTFTQGAQFLGLSLLPSVTVTLMLNFTPVVVGLIGIYLLNENPTRNQWFGIGLFAFGVITYFFPIQLAGNRGIGLLVMCVGILANSGASILGRHINREKRISPLLITVISMGIGSTFLIVPGIIIQGIPSISLTNGILLVWMSVVNTAFTYTLWNRTLRSLSAMESSIINGTMLIQIGILSWIFLGETISIQEGFGMFLAAVGAVAVQLRFDQNTRSRISTIKATVSQKEN